MVAVPGAGFRLKHPNAAVDTRSLPEQLPELTSAGRSAGTPSPFVSRPVVMLYGDPLEITMNGLTLNRSGSGRDDPSSTRCRTSANPEGPHSDRRLYGSAGCPSAWLFPSGGGQKANRR